MEKTKIINKKVWVLKNTKDDIMYVDTFSLWLHGAIYGSSSMVLVEEDSIEELLESSESKLIMLGKDFTEEMKQNIRNFTELRDCKITISWHE